MAARDLVFKGRRSWGNRKVMRAELTMIKHVRSVSRFAAVLLLGMLTCGTGAIANAEDNLYRAQTIVTGQGEANRVIGFAACLEDVLIKVSGMLKLAGDPRLDAYKSKAGDFVKAHHYTTRCPASQSATNRARAIGPMI